jgi:hypothetical protein
MKERVIILAEGGVCGNFICTLLQTLHSPDMFNKLEIPAHGSMDLIAQAGTLTNSYLLGKKQFSIYPERTEAMNVLMNELKNPESLYKSFQSNYEKQFHEVHVLHYQWQSHISKFLSLPNTKIIFVRYNPNDHKRIAVNRITKSFVSDANPSDDNSKNFKKTGYEELLVWSGFTDVIDELRSLDDTDHASKTLIDTLILAWSKYINERNIHSNPKPHKNMLILNFNDLYFNKEIIMQSLSEFAGLPINDSTRSIYDDYLSNQPNIDLY